MISRKRILFVIENAAYGGGEKTFATLIRSLSRERFEVFCASLPRGRFYDEVKDFCRFYPLDLTNRFNLRNIPRLKKIMLDNSVDLAHSQGARADFYCALAAERAGVSATATIAMPVEGFDVGFLRKKSYSYLADYAAGKIAGIITVSPELAYTLRKKFPKVVLIPNSVDLTEFAPENFYGGTYREQYPIEGRLVFGALGRLEWQKGYGVLLDAMAALLKRKPAMKDRAVCLIAGSGSLETKLKARAAELRLSENVIFCGEADSAGEFLGAVDIFIMPSLLEGQPLALLEAMAMAKPIVASAIPGIKGTVEPDIDAVLVPPGDPAALAVAMLKLIADPRAAAELGRTARERAGYFALPEYIMAHERFYSEILSGGRR